MTLKTTGMGNIGSHASNILNKNGSPPILFSKKIAAWLTGNPFPRD